MVLIVAAAAWLGYYDMKAFGKATTLPYTIDRNTYAISPYYIWQHPRPEPITGPPSYEILPERGDGLLQEDSLRPGVRTFFAGQGAKRAAVFCGPILILPLIMLRRVCLDRRIRFLMICALVLVAGMSLRST